METKTLALVTKALAPTEAILRKEYERQLIAQYDALLVQLAADGWDANVHFDYPSGNLGRKAYAEQVARFKLCEKYTDGVKGSRSSRDPNIRVAKSDNYANISKEAAKLAKSALEGYCAKLAGKIDAHLAARTINECSDTIHKNPTLQISYEGNLNPWGWSHVLVACSDADSYVWETKMIVNVSCLGKVFNQWPTRLAGTRK